jgi:small subunit ribosomal protein S8
MAVNDPLADFFTRIRNASLAGHRYVDTFFSNLNVAVAEVLKSAKFIENATVIEVEGKQFVRVSLRYTQNRMPFIRNIKKVSNPGRRKYVAHDEIPTVMNGLGISILSTPKGVLAGAEARKQHCGGELLCLVW